MVSVISAEVCLTPDSNRIIGSIPLCASVYSHGLVIMSDDIVLDCRGSRFVGEGLGSGIMIDGRRNITIKDCIIKGFENGIAVQNSADVTLQSVMLIDNKVGIFLMDSPDAVVDDISYQANIRDIVNMTNAPEERAESDDIPFDEPDTSYQARIDVNFDEDITRLFNEIKTMFSGYIENSSSFVDVKRDIVYDSDRNVTTIIVSFDPRVDASNYSYYEMMPKCLARYVKEVVFSDRGYEVIADDPIVMWNFAELNNPHRVVYSVAKELGEDCTDLLEGFGFATEIALPDADEEEIGMNTYFYALVGVIVSVILIRIVIWIRSMSD